MWKLVCFAWIRIQMPAVRLSLRLDVIVLVCEVFVVDHEPIGNDFAIFRAVMNDRCEVDTCLVATAGPKLLNLA